jgi:Lrp/AsnC family leucine-responsive transcriptional regulator
MKPRHRIDDVDVKILKALLSDARASFADIAKESNLSIPAITQRYRKMKQNGIITGTSLITNLGYKEQHSLSVDIKIESGYETSIIEAIKKIPRFRSCYKVIGKYDIHAGIRVESLEQIAKIKKALGKEKGVLEINITTSIDELYYFPENLVFLPKGDSHSRTYKRRSKIVQGNRQETRSVNSVNHA